MNTKTNQDLLNREKFVALLKDIVAQQSLNENNGFSFAIDGKWGCGKTFILNMLEDQLRNEGYLVLHYNCWENDFYDEPLMAIISVIINELEHLVKNKMASGVKKRAKSCLKFLRRTKTRVSPLVTPPFGSIPIMDICSSDKTGLDRVKKSVIYKENNFVLNLILYKYFDFLRFIYYIYILDK